MIGVIGGLLGAMYIRANNKINAVRKSVLKTKNLKIIEGLVLTAVTVSVFYMAITLKYTICKCSMTRLACLYQFFSPVSMRTR